MAPHMHSARPHLLALAVAAAFAPSAARAADFFWTTGDFVTGTTAPEPLLSGDTLFIQSGGAKRFVGSSFTNQGLVRWQADILQGGNSAPVTNSGVWQSESDTNSLTHSFGGQPTFFNSGTFRKTAGATTNVGSWRFQNDGGMVDAQVGNIVFNAGSNIFNAGSRFTGAGQVQVAGGSTFTGNFMADNLVLTAGSHIGSGAILAGGAGLSSGLLGWTGGDLNGSWSIGAGATLTGRDGGAKRQVGSAIVNDGTFRWATSNTLQGGNSSTFTNNGLLEATASALFQHNFGGQPGYVNASSGTFRATNNATLTLGGVALTSDGGLFEAHAGSAIVYSGTTNRFNGGTRFVGDNAVTGNARFVDVIQSDNLRLISGTQTGGDGSAGSRGRLAGTVGFEGGDLQGAWEIQAGATMTASGANAKRQVGSDIVNNGLIMWSADTPLQGGNSSVLTNNSRFEVTTDADLTHNFGGVPRVDNNGLFIKTGGAGDSSLAAVTLTNAGTIDVRSGSITLPASFVNAGTLKGTGAFNVSGTLSNNGHVGPGASPGVLTINGNFLQSALGFFDVEMETLSNFDLLLINGTATLGGGLALSCFASCEFSVGDEVVILDSTGNLTGTFASVTLSGFATGAFDVVYDTVGDRVLLRITEDVTAAIPEPGTYALMLGGLGLLGWMGRRRRRAG